MGERPTMRAGGLHTVGEGDGDRATVSGTGHDMAVGDDVAVRPNDEARAARALAATTHRQARRRSAARRRRSPSPRPEGHRSDGRHREDHPRNGCRSARRPTERPQRPGLPRPVRPAALPAPARAGWAPWLGGAAVDVPRRRSECSPHHATGSLAPVAAGDRRFQRARRDRVGAPRTAAVHGQTAEEADHQHRRSSR